jgi:energy-coupling factor transporter ATP-binding protein EcfA2
MQKIIIHNFGPVKDAEIEIKKVLVLIGEQATGKSTIAKLIYFFYELKNEIHDKINDFILKGKNFDEDLFKQYTRNRFLDYFSTLINNSSFSITFYYDVQKNKSLHFFIDKNKHLNLKLSDHFFSKEDFKSLEPGLEELSRATEQRHFYMAIGRVREVFNQIINLKKRNNLFVIAGRSATVGYSELFEKYLFAELLKKIENNINHKYSIVDSLILKQFIEHVVYLKEYVINRLKVFGNNVIELRKTTPISPVFEQKALAILKGKYTIDNFGEKITHQEDNKRSTFLSDASSGQQEVVRILQDLEHILTEKKTVLRVVEEPEAHLFPTAQKELIELFSLIINQNTDNQLIITTHSPYILTAFNNLLFGQAVIDKNPLAEEAVNAIVEKECRINATDFAAYSLSKKEADSIYCETIFEEKTGLIDQNYLDVVSEEMGNDFNALYRIHAQSFVRK